MEKAVFLDRDGTINIEKNYLYKPEEFEFIPGAIEAIRIFKKLGYRVIVVTNQAGVAKGYYSEEDVVKLHDFIEGLLTTNNTSIDEYYYCPHHPNGIIEPYNIICSCRKPEIGLIDQACKKFNFDLENCIFIGDKEIDVETGIKANIGKRIIVKSGHFVDTNNTKADGIYENIYEYAVCLYKEKNENLIS